jgi:hypothetical protein
MTLAGSEGTSLDDMLGVNSVCGEVNVLCVSRGDARRKAEDTRRQLQGPTDDAMFEMQSGSYELANSGD